MNAFQLIAETLIANNIDATTHVSKKEYELFRKEYIFEVLKGLRYGEAFCERFQIKDPVISRITNINLAEELIKANYIK